MYILFMNRYNNNTHFRYPIYRIPVGSTLKDLGASFLVFHSLSTQNTSTSLALSLSVSLCLSLKANHYLLMQVAPRHLSFIKQIPDMITAFLIQWQESPYPYLPWPHADRKDQFCIPVGPRKANRRTVFSKLQTTGSDACRLVFQITSTSGGDVLSGDDMSSFGNS